MGGPGWVFVASALGPWPSPPPPLLVDVDPESVPKAHPPLSISGVAPPSTLALMSHLTVAIGGKAGQTGCMDEQVHRPGDGVQAQGEAARELGEEAGPGAAGGHWSPRPWPHWLFAIWSHASPTLRPTE